MLTVDAQEMMLGLNGVQTKISMENGVQHLQNIVMNVMESYVEQFND
jgi:hypothetical protein